MQLGQIHHTRRLAHGSSDNSKRACTRCTAQNMCKYSWLTITMVVQLAIAQRATLARMCCAERSRAVISLHDARCRLGRCRAGRGSRLLLRRLLALLPALLRRRLRPCQQGACCVTEQRQRRE